ncbi:ABC transporter substrate-binding protein [Hydrogenophaga sp. UC242_50]|uniref:ABC transporter substrate-binding protein n=1 Tax=Hydrogenophaga sp. UC242_50 TaxID=3350169 RepID=UPI0036D43F2C
MHTFIATLRSLVRPLAVATLLSAAAAPVWAQKIVFGFSASTAFANAFVAANEGLFKKHGLDVEMKLVPNSATTPAALMAGSLQIATPTAPNTMQAVEQGLDLVVLAGGGYYTKGMEDAGDHGPPRQPHQDRQGLRGQASVHPGPQRLPARAVPQMDGRERR